MEDVKATLGELYGVFGIGEGLSLLICFCLSVCLIALAPPGLNACALMTAFTSPSLVFFWEVGGGDETPSRHFLFCQDGACLTLYNVCVCVCCVVTQAADAVVL